MPICSPRSPRCVRRFLRPEWLDVGSGAQAEAPGILLSSVSIAPHRLEDMARKIKRQPAISGRHPQQRLDAPSAPLQSPGIALIL